MNGLEGGLLAFLLHPIRDNDDGGGGVVKEEKEMKEDPTA